MGYEYPEFENLFTIEARPNNSSLWVVIWSSSNASETIERYAHAVSDTDGTQYRLTSPTPTL